MRKNKRKYQRKSLFKKVIILIVVLLLGTFGIYYFIHEETLKKEEEKVKEQEITIKSHYNESVVTNEKVKIYKKINNQYEESGEINKGIELSLEKQDVTIKDTYFKITNLPEEYYIYYSKVTPIEKLTTTNSDRYKRYIPFNKNIITKEKTSFYDENVTLQYTINKSFDLPIIVNDNPLYGVEYNGKLLYVKNEDIAEIKDSQNTTLSNTKGVSVLNYHFFYDENDSKERASCNQEICHSKKQFRTHLEYIKEKNILTLTMKELEWYIDGKVQLPRSVAITIDDGWMSGHGVELLNEYKLNGTVFLITKSYDPQWIVSPYVEAHSHSDNLHRNNICNKGNQGGAILCDDSDSIIADLKLSREKLSGSTVFCYPFYDYDARAMELVKEAGFTMAFVGGEYRKVVVHDNKYKLPRYVIGTWTTLEDFKRYVAS